MFRFALRRLLQRIVGGRWPTGECPHRRVGLLCTCWLSKIACDMVSAIRGAAEFEKRSRNHNLRLGVRAQFRKVRGACACTSRHSGLRTKNADATGRQDRSVKGKSGTCKI